MDESKYQLLASRQILLGDFNAHTPLLGVTDTNAEGTTLEKIVDDNHLIVLNDKTGTYLKRDGNMSYLDATVTSRDIALKCSWRVHTDNLGSDHLPIIIT